MIDLEHLSVRIGRTAIIDDVTMSIPRGTWCTFVGPNGAGKTTLVKALAGLREPSQGYVRIDGRDVAILGERDRARLVSYVAQHPNVPTGLSVGEYVAMGRVAHHGTLSAATAQDREIVDQVIKRVGLDAFLHRDGASLSGGERQRMVLARALAQSTPVMILDEPITGLDVHHQMEILDLLRSEVEEFGLTVVATLHDLTLAGYFADRLVLLDHGHIRRDGPCAEVVRSPEMSDSYAMDLLVVEVEGVDVVVPRQRWARS